MSRMGYCRVCGAITSRDGDCDCEKDTPRRETVGESFKRGWNEPVADSVHSVRKWLIIIGGTLMLVSGVATCTMWAAGF